MEGSPGASRNCDCQQQGGREPGSSGIRSTQVKRCSVVNLDKRKLLIRLGQNGTWPGPEATNSSGADTEPPAYRRDLSHSDISAERGNPVVFPASHTNE